LKKYLQTFASSSDKAEVIMDVTPGAQQGLLDIVRK
jgi:hypothetical protein